MNYFGFIVHYLSLTDLRELYKIYPYLSYLHPLLKNLSKIRMENLAKKLPPHKILTIKNITSPTGKRIGAIGIMCPLSPKHIFTLNKEVVINKLITSVKLAKKMGAKIVGLAGFTSIISNQGQDLKGKVDIALTTGNTYTASLALEGLKKAGEIFGKEIKESRVAVIGATGDIGSICAKILAKQAKEIILCARGIEQANDFINQIKKINKNLLIEKYPEKAASDADFILTATSATTTILEPQSLKRGAIVCDVAVPPNIAREVSQLRQDVFVFEGGKARFSNFQSIKNRVWNNLFSDGSIYGCLAETMILAFEGIFQDFSLGRGNITEDKIDSISNLARKYGFGLAPFRCGDTVYTEEEIVRIKNRIRG
jgi:predicted amino acid dehydrogenase